MLRCDWLEGACSMTSRDLIGRPQLFCIRARAVLHFKANTTQVIHTYLVYCLSIHIRGLHIIKAEGFPVTTVYGIMGFIQYGAAHKQAKNDVKS